MHVYLIPLLYMSSQYHLIYPAIIELILSNFFAVGHTPPMAPPIILKPRLRQAGSANSIRRLAKLPRFAKPHLVNWDLEKIVRCQTA